MKKIAVSLGILAVAFVQAQSIKTNIDLVNVKDDKVAVTMEFPKMKSGNVKFHFPKTVPEHILWTITDSIKFFR